MMNKFSLAIAIMIAIVFGSAIFFTLTTKNPPVALARDLCVKHETTASMHIHPQLEIYLEDEPVLIPANIGITEGCMKSVHTHDLSGKIHLEYPYEYRFELKDFFANWGQPFSQDQILDRRVDAEHVLTMTVDGQPSQAFEDLILRENQQVVIRYEKKTVAQQ